jgi:polysaccharide biosynthesis transport protein
MNQKTDPVKFQSFYGDGAENPLEEYITICRRRWRLIVGFTVGCAVVAAVWSYLQTPIYQAKSTVVIEREGAGALEKDKYNPQDISPEYFQTHFELMKSRQVLQRTARLLELSNQPEYRPQRSAIKEIVCAILPEAFLEFLKPKDDDAGVPDEEEKEDLILKSFSKQIDIMPIRGARLAHITVHSKDPKFAARAANMLATVYIDGITELSANSNGKAAQWFTDQADNARNKVATSQQALYLFRAKHGLLEGPEHKAVAAQKITELNTELFRAEIEKAKAQTRYELIERILRGRSENGEINWANLDASTEVLSSSLIQMLRAQEIKVSGQLAELSDKYGSLHPKMARARAELQDLRERIQQEVQKIYDSVKREYDGALARERAIHLAVSRHKQEKIKLEQYEIEQGILEREAESSQHLYDIFLKVTKEADILSGVKTSNVYIADLAVASSLPVKPRKSLYTMLGLLVGLITGTALAFFLEGRDRSLKGPDDVERYLPSVSLLGMVPLLSRRDTTNADILPSISPLGLAAESFRTIRTSLLLSNPGQLPSCVLITSPGMSEGKTTLAVHLATSLAQLEETRVLLIDADLRKSHAHPIFEIPTGNGPPKGLVDFLASRAGFREVIHPTEVPNLFVVPSGNCPSNPSELLHSKHMSVLLNRCQEEGFHIILDAPPVLHVTDPVILATKVSGVLLVISAGKTTREGCRLAIQSLAAAGGRILGIVLQKARITAAPHYYAYGSHLNGLVSLPQRTGANDPPL